MTHPRSHSQLAKGPGLLAPAQPPSLLLHMLRGSGCPTRDRDGDQSPIKRELGIAVHFQTLAFNSQAGHLTPCPTQAPEDHPEAGALRSLSLGTIKHKRGIVA